VPIGLRCARAIAYVIAHAMLFAASALEAQSTGQQSLMWLDIGGAAIQQPHGATRPAGSFGIGGLHQRRAWTLMGDAALTMANDSVAASQLVVRSLWTPARARWSTTEVEASLLSAGLSGRGRDGSRSVALRERVKTRGIEAFVLGGAAVATRGTLNTGGAALQVGLRAARGPFSASASFQHATTDDYVLAEASGYFLREFPSNYAMRDATVGLSWRNRAVAVDLMQAWRRGIGNTRGRSSAPSARMVWTVSPPLALVAYGGRQLADVLRGVPQADYVGLSARWMIGARRGRAAAAVAPGARADGIAESEATLTRVPGASALELRVDAAADATVEIASSIRDWSPQPATRDGDRFVLRLALPSGSHRVAVRINGGAWRAPRGLVAVPDDFGGTAGVVVVP